ncbi:MAG TPA: 50S ribosomal protein L10 [Planctomycetaceae bacterium]|nr:50S ribosomal protein L10 [Planctomycetaceae bacterium]
MSKPVKNMLIDDVRRRIGDVRDLLVIDSSRLDALSANRFRLALREKQISLLTVKNTLARRALNDAGVTALDPVLEGPSTIVWGGEDIVALSKEIARWAKELEPLQIKGGAVEGTTLDAAGVEQLSRSPSREELIGQIAGLILSPGAQLAGALLGPGGYLAGQLKALADKEVAEPAAP